MHRKSNLTKVLYLSVNQNIVSMANRFSFGKKEVFLSKILFFRWLEQPMNIMENMIVLLIVNLQYNVKVKITIVNCQSKQKLKQHCINFKKISY